MINIYCDESCHLEKDDSNVMVLGAMSCPSDIKGTVFEDIREIKLNNGLNSRFEIKWTKVSVTKVDFYKQLIDYFFNNDNLSFRTIIARGKKSLDHKKYNNNDYDEWYYKIYFRLLDPIVDEYNNYKILIDIKDTNGGPRVKKLRKVLCYNKYDYKEEVISGIYQINSKESEILQLADLFIGAMSFYHRGLHKIPGSNRGKIEIVEYLIQQYNINLDIKTSKFEQKFNLFIWDGRR